MMLFKDMMIILFLVVNKSACRFCGLFDGAFLLRSPRFVLLVTLPEMNDDFSGKCDCDCNVAHTTQGFRIFPMCGVMSTLRECVS